MNTADPWRVPVVVAQIPNDGMHRAFEATEAVRAAMAEVAGLREIISASASFDSEPLKVHSPLPSEMFVSSICMAIISAPNVKW